MLSKYMPAKWITGLTALDSAIIITPLFILVEICRSMGRLASGIPQVPIRSGVKPMMSSSPEPILASLRSPQPVMLLKCGPDPRSRWYFFTGLNLYFSRNINDFASQKYKWLCTSSVHLIPNTPLIQLWCARSKWNMDLKIIFSS